MISLALCGGAKFRRDFQCEPSIPPLRPRTESQWRGRSLVRAIFFQSTFVSPAAPHFVYCCRELQRSITAKFPPLGMASCARQGRMLRLASHIQRVRRPPPHRGDMRWYTPSATSHSEGRAVLRSALSSVTGASDGNSLALPPWENFSTPLGWTR